MEKQNLFSSAKHHFNLATRLVESSETYFIDFSDDPLLTTQLAWILKFIKLQDISEHSYVAGMTLHPEFVARKKQWNSTHAKKVQEFQKCLPDHHYQTEI